MDHLDSAVTVLLVVVALLGWVRAGVIVGVTSVMMSDSGAPGLAWVGVLVSAYGIVLVNLTLFGTDERRRRERPPEPEPVVVPEAPATAVSYTVFTYTAIHRIPDQGMTIELGVEQHTGRRYLRTPMPQRGGEYDEYHGIDVAPQPLATPGRVPGPAADQPWSGPVGGKDRHPADRPSHYVCRRPGRRASPRYPLRPNGRRHPGSERGPRGQAARGATTGFTRLRRRQQLAQAIEGGGGRSWH